MNEVHSVRADLIRVVAILAVAICLVPEGAHFFELPNKMGLSPAEYMIVQKVYMGWAFWHGESRRRAGCRCCRSCRWSPRS